MGATSSTVDRADADQHPEVELLLEVAEVVEALGERNGEQEGEQDLHPRQRHAQLLQQLREVAVRPLLRGVSSRPLPGSGPPRKAQECLTAIDSIMCADVSVESMARSSTPKMSFQRITTIGSIPFENSDASASRQTRSPSFSSRWISIQ